MNLSKTANSVALGLALLLQGCSSVQFANPFKPSNQERQYEFYTHNEAYNLGRCLNYLNPRVVIIKENEMNNLNSLSGKEKENLEKKLVKKYKF